MQRVLLLMSKHIQVELYLLCFYAAQFCFQVLAIKALDLFFYILSLFLPTSCQTISIFVIPLSIILIFFFSLAFREYKITFFFVLFHLNFHLNTGYWHEIYYILSIKTSNCWGNSHLVFNFWQSPSLKIWKQRRISGRIEKCNQ